jgi:hypothetical protein
MYDDTTISLVIQCWLHIPIHREDRKHATNAVFYLLVKLHPDAPPDVLDKIFDSIPVETITRRIKKTLLDPRLLNGALCQELCAIQAFSQSRRPWGDAFLRGRVCDSVCQAIVRQIEIGSEEQTYHILHVGDYLLRCVVRDFWLCK